MLSAVTCCRGVLCPVYLVSGLTRFVVTRVACGNENDDHNDHNIGDNDDDQGDDDEGDDDDGNDE